MARQKVQCIHAIGWYFEKHLEPLNISDYDNDLSTSN